MSKSRWLAYAVFCLIGLVYGWSAVECHLGNKVLFGISATNEFAWLYGVFAALVVALGVASSVKFCWMCRTGSTVLTVAAVAVLDLSYLALRQGVGSWLVVMFQAILMMAIAIAYTFYGQRKHARGEWPIL